MGSMGRDLCGIRRTFKCGLKIKKFASIILFFFFEELILRCGTGVVRLFAFYFLLYDNL